MGDYFKEAVEFLKNIKKEDGVIIVFNNDADGVSACTIVKEYLEKQIGIKPFIISQPMPTEKDLIKKIQSSIPTKIIFLDLAMDQQSIVIKKLHGISDILVIDHHSIHSNLNEGNVTHHNPRFVDFKIYQSATYLSYKICSEIFDTDYLLWVAAIGMIGDYNLDYSQDLVKIVKEKYSLEGDLYKTFLGRIADMISAIRSTNMMSCEEAVEVFQNVKNPENFSEAYGSDVMIKSLEIMDSEMNRLEKDFKETSETHGNLITYEIVSEYNLCSPISTKLSGDFKDKMLMVYQISGSKVHVSARNQGQIFDVAKIMKDASRNLRGDAGGHPAAAGATISIEDWDSFKDKIIKNINY